MVSLNSGLLSLKQLCYSLAISEATGKNWLKLGKIIPQAIDGKKSYFSSEYVNNLKNDLKNGDNLDLRSRRNKKYISGVSFYNSYVKLGSINTVVIQDLLEEIENLKIDLDENIQRFLLAECAIQLLLGRLGYSHFKAGSLLIYLKNQLGFIKYDKLIDDLIEDKKQAMEFVLNYPTLFSFEYSYEKNEDTLGLLYLSSKSLTRRKSQGIYYTPQKLVDQLIQNLAFSTNDLRGKKILDPCCGTGNFLINLPETVDICNIYGNDIDDLAIKLARLNLAIKYQPKKIEILYCNITNKDFIRNSCDRAYDYIIGNPPWGSCFSEIDECYLKDNFLCAKSKKTESFNVFIEAGLKLLPLNGVLSFIVPEAILNVKSHIYIRELIASTCSITYLAFLGDSFDKVQCPSVIMQLKNTQQAINTEGMIVKEENREFKILKKRKVSSDYFSFRITDQENAILEKIERKDNCVYLMDNAIYALGIVTGNNDKYITNEKNENNELVLRGTDIFKYKFKKNNNFICYCPRNFQQVAQDSYYRANEKLIYRFINKQLIFAYDNKQTLSLNSCNIVIPKIPNVSIKYIMMVLNSRILQFIFSKKFNSLKVLKAHIEQLPIPQINACEQLELEKIADRLINEEDKVKIEYLYNMVDKKIADLFNLSDSEYGIILDSINDDNSFLG